MSRAPRGTQEDGRSPLGEALPGHTPAQLRPWAIAQAASVAATAALVVGLFTTPRAALDLLWNGLVPLLPAVFLVNPRIWRNVCPLATANQLSGSRWGRRRLTPETTRRLGMLGIGLFFILVPARRFAFNENGPLLAVSLIGLALIALLLGFLFATRAGFCNTLCPILPVERLYGQRPLIDVANARCATCELCTGAGCIDLAPRKSIAQTLGRRRRSHGWLLTPFGAFAAALPGFVVAYFTSEDGPLSVAPGIYVHVLAWTLGSYAAVVFIVHVFRLGSQKALLFLGGVAASVYYWYASPAVVSSLELAPATGSGLRVLTLGLVAFWLVRSLRQAPKKGGPTPRQAG